jgi:hypothetical protein
LAASQEGLSFMELVNNKIVSIGDMMINEIGGEN